MRSLHTAKIACPLENLEFTTENRRLFPTLSGKFYLVCGVFRREHKRPGERQVLKFVLLEAELSATGEIRQRLLYFDYDPGGGFGGGKSLGLAIGVDPNGTLVFRQGVSPEEVSGGDWRRLGFVSIDRLSSNHSLSISGQTNLCEELGVSDLNGVCNITGLEMLQDETGAILALVTTRPLVKETIFDLYVVATDGAPRVNARLRVGRKVNTKIGVGAGWVGVGSSNLCDLSPQSCYGGLYWNYHGSNHFYLVASDSGGDSHYIQDMAAFSASGDRMAVLLSGRGSKPSWVAVFDLLKPRSGDVVTTDQNIYRIRVPKTTRAIGVNSAGEIIGFDSNRIINIGRIDRE